jgi:4-hydroxy 2-oxovalerate aldolase
MNKLYLLDCTLRDGGFVNDWRFGLLTIRSIVRRLDAAGIDIIECGFLDSRNEYEKDRTLFPNIPSVAKTLGNMPPKQAMLVAMIDYGAFDENLLIPKPESILDGIRLIFKKEHIEAALEQALKIKKLGYKLFLNPVALTSYRTSELVSLVQKINDVQPFGMSIVDTYGLMFHDDVERYITIINGDLDTGIALGYHCHDNLGIATAHTINYACKRLKRNMVVDVSVLGMGKNAGNARTEAVASTLDKMNLKQFDVNQIFDCAYTDIQKFNVKSNWGYGLDTLLSAIHDCSPNWISFLMNKNTLSVKGVRTILDSLPYEKREVSYFNETLAEQKYLEYMDNYVNDGTARDALSVEINGHDVLLLCPGKTLNTHRCDIDTYIIKNNPIVITVNFITDKFKADYAFISNSNRYSQMLGLCSEIMNLPSILLTSNIVPTDAIPPIYIFNYKTLYESIMGDNSAGLLISLLKNINMKHIAIAGMDGFDKNEINKSFFDSDMALGISNNANSILIDQLKRVIDGNINIEWITPSKIKEALAVDIDTLDN